MSAALRGHARGLVSATVVLACLACGRERSSRPDSANAPTGSSASAPAGGGATQDDSARPGAGAAPRVVGINSACVSEGTWQSCSVERRLIDAGFVLITKGPAPTGVFPVAGSSYMLGAADLYVYLFPSAKAREAAIAGIDTVAIAPRGGVASWPTPHTLITSNNLVAVLISDNGRLVERVQNAITAGLPSAAR